MANVLSTAARALSALLIAALLGGCALPGDEGGRNKLADCGAVAADDGPGAGSATGHGQPQRNDGEVSIRQQGGEFHATRLVTLVNDFGGAGSAQVTLDSFNGAVASCVRQGGGYRINVLLEGRGSNESEARSALDSMQVTHGDTLVAGALRLITRVETTAASNGNLSLLGTEIGLGSSGTDSPQRSASIVAGLPAAASYDLNQSTRNGDVSAYGFSGTSAGLDSNNGSVGLDGRWDRATLGTTNGIIGVSGDYATLEAHSSNGYVQAALQTRRSLSADLSAANGSVDIALAASTAGFDLVADTLNGRAGIEVAGTTAIGEQTGTHAQRRTPDYDSRAVKVQVSASSSNGDAGIHQ